MALSQRLQLLINRNDEGYVIRSHRDPLALMYWNIVFEHHQGLLFLLQNHYPAPAFALLRILQEAAFRLIVVMNGTENQFVSIKTDTYKTDFVEVGKLIDQKLESGPIVQLRTQDTIKALHGFTHGGPHQLTRQFCKLDDSLNIMSNFSDSEIRGLVNETIPIVSLTAAFTTEFFNMVTENSTALQLLDEHVRSMVTA